jgi:D-galactarolactone cycloisomerase
MSEKILAEHYIKEIRTLRISSRYTRTIGRNSRIKNHGDGPNTQIRVIITDKGAMGWGASYTPEDQMPNFIGLSIAELFKPEIGIVTDEAMPLDYALHDLAAVIMDQPVYKMLGYKGKLAIPCYDGAIYMDDLVPEESPRGVSAIIQNCKNDYDMGYRDFKIKIGRGLQWMGSEDGLKRDIDVTRAVFENFPDCRILVDANDAYTCDGMINYMDAVSDCNIFWIEEPFRENRDDLIKLKEFLSKKSPDTLVVDGESRPDVDFLLELAREKLLDALQMDISGYGFTNWRKIMPRLIDAGVPAAPHAWGDPLKVIYSAQLSAGLGNTLMLEGIPSKTYEADLGLYKLEDGILHVPENIPGFGMKLESIHY